MFLIKFLFFNQILFLIFFFSFSNYTNNQRILVKSTDNNKNEDGSAKIKLLRMEVNKINDQTKIKILLEINKKNGEILPFVKINVDSEASQKIKNINENGRKLILIEKFHKSLRIYEVVIYLKEIGDKTIRQKVRLNTFILKNILGDQIDMKIIKSPYEMPFPSTLKIQ